VFNAADWGCRVSARNGWILALASAFALGSCQCSTSPKVGPQDGGSTTDGGGGGGDSGAVSDAGQVSQHVVPTFCPGCPPFPGTSPDGGFPLGDLDAGVPPCTGAGVNPTLVYPNDGSLFPPNTNVIEVQFLPGTGNQYFEVDFENAITDVRVETQCTAITNAVGTATGGCGLALDSTTWGYIANNNAGGEPLTVTVRATPNGNCVAGSNWRTMSFAAQAVQGAIYYWQSVVFGTLQGTSGGIYRYDFGTQAAAPSPFLVPSSTSAFANRCIGCHFISRDGQKMTFGLDDTDADDEYSDLRATLLDVAAYSDGGTVTNAMLSPGFQTFSPNHLDLLGSDGLPRNNPAAFFLYDGTTGASATPATVPSSARATQPDWSADGSHIVYVVPKAFFASGMGNCMGCAMGPPPNSCPTAPPYNCTCVPPNNGGLYDNHFAGGSLFTMAVTGGNSFGSPASLLPSAGENNYYPSWAPDDAFILFNRAAVDGGLADDAFSNPSATIWALPSGGGTPVELKALEEAGVAADAGHPFPSGGLTNSWARFSPFVQTYKGKKLYWVTFSSTRDYGLRVQNQLAGEINCYPPESPENACSGKQQLTQPNCAQPQIWMAALTEDGLAAGDTSFPAFWLPFQSIAAHNHIAQWANALVGGTDAGTCFEGGCGDAGTSDGGTCGGFNASCSASAPCCGALVCVAPSNTCQLPIQ
jgi:hypothetical protein